MIHKTETVIIGAGPAGLAVAGCLRQRKLAFEILEAKEQVGYRWANHYDRLHLHTSKRNSGLPGFPMPKDYPRYPSRDQVVAYLEAYARKFQLNPHFGQEVVAVTQVDSTFRIDTKTAAWECRQVVIANGLSHTPKVPSFPGQESFPGTILHASAYRNGKTWKGKKVLVVGFGNSGGEIAVDLVESGAQPALAVRSAVNIIPKEVMGMPSTDISVLTSWLPYWLVDKSTMRIVRKKFGDFSAFGLEKSAFGPREQVEKTGRIPLIDIGTMALIKKGEIGVFRGVQRMEGNRVFFAGGNSETFEAIILATGYQPNFSFLPHNPYFQQGIRDGIPPVVGEGTGLYFCGFRNPPTGAIRGMGKDARKIADDIARKRG